MGLENPYTQVHVTERKKNEKEKEQKRINKTNTSPEFKVET